MLWWKQGLLTATLLLFFTGLCQWNAMQLCWHFCKNRCTYVDGWWFILWFDGKINAIVFVLHFWWSMSKNPDLIMFVPQLQALHWWFTYQGVLWCTIQEGSQMNNFYANKLYLEKNLFRSFFELLLLYFCCHLLSFFELPAADAVVAPCLVVSLPEQKFSRISFPGYQSCHDAKESDVYNHTACHWNHWNLLSYVLVAKSWSRVSSFLSTRLVSIIA